MHVPLRIVFLRLMFVHGEINRCCVGNVNIIYYTIIFGGLNKKLFYHVYLKIILYSCLMDDHVS